MKCKMQKPFVLYREKERVKNRFCLLIYSEKKNGREGEGEKNVNELFIAVLNDVHLRWMFNSGGTSKVIKGNEKRGTREQRNKNKKTELVWERERICCCCLLK